MKAEIITIGTEILLGDIVNTNAQYLSKELALLGVSVYHQTVVGDNEDRIFQAFKDGYNRNDIIITTGGLGPTPDDLTKEVASKYFNKELELHEKSLEEIKAYFNIKDGDLKGSNEKQAYFPKGAKVLPNKFGTAPGAIIEENNKIMIILPGPPREMKPMFEEYVVPYLKMITDNVIVSKTLRVFGIGEGIMAEEVKEYIEKGKNPTVAPYAKEFDVTLRITAKAFSEEDGKRLIDPVECKIREILKDNIYGEGETTLENVVGEMLCRNNLTIATTESCTGGMVAAKLISYPGISKVFLEGAVTYSNEAKMKRLGVKSETLEKYGAVSEETAREMASGIAEASGAKIAISTTGIAGPGGGSTEKPVGLVYIGIYINGKTVINKFVFKGERDKVRIKSTMNALDILRRELLKEGYK